MYCSVESTVYCIVRYGTDCSTALLLHAEDACLLLLVRRNDVPVGCASAGHCWEPNGVGRDESAANKRHRVHFVAVLVFFLLQCIFGRLEQEALRAIRIIPNSRQSLETL